MQDTWASRDLPVLDAAVRLLEQRYDVRVGDIATEAGLDLESVVRALDALEGPYVAEISRTMATQVHGPSPTSRLLLGRRSASGPRRNPSSNVWPRPSARPPSTSRTRSGRAGSVRWPASSALPDEMWPRRSCRRSSCTRPGWASDGPKPLDAVLGGSSGAAERQREPPVHLACYSRGAGA
jgi:hypothetical protein